MIRENPANRGTETSAEDLVGPPERMVSNACPQPWYGRGVPKHPAIVAHAVSWPTLSPHVVGLRADTVRATTTPPSAWFKFELRSGDQVID